MFRRVFLLNGLAIVAVVCNHATIWGITAMFWWADRYRPVAVPNFDLDATLPYYMLLLFRKLAVFGVPAFLFFSGFFLNYAASGKGGLNWKTVRVRVQALLIPYAIWFTLWWLREVLSQQTYTPGQVASRLFLGWPVGAYWYIPIITFFYLLSPFLVRLARARPYRLLLAAGLLHLAEMGVSYLLLGQQLAGAGVPGDEAAAAYAGHPLHLHLIFYFVFGLVVGVRRQDFEQRLKGRVWYLLFAVLVLGALAVLEAELVYRTTSLDWRSSTNTLPTSLYALAIILFFLAVQEIPKHMTKVCHGLATRMFGIYLVHGLILEFTARATQKYVPGLLAYTTLFQVVIVVAAVAGSVLAIEAVARSPLRSYSKYLFG